jgi:hypothetical protein
MTRRINAAYASALAAGALMVLSGCGGSGSAAATKTEGAALLGERLTGMVAQVDKMGIVEWHGQLLTKSPDKGGKRILDLDARFSPSTGYSEVSMDTTIDGNAQQIDYLVVNDRTFFNSEVWGPGASDCWVDITDDEERSWALPRELDPKWALTQGRALSADEDDVSVSLGFKDVLAGLPKGLFDEVPSVPYDTEAKAFIEPHGHLIEVGVDVAGMWSKLPKAQRASLDARVGWWAMTMKEATNGTSVVPPKYVFDPKVTPPSQCKRP